MRTRFERSAGGVVVRRVDESTGNATGTDPNAYEVILASRRRRDGTLAWGLAKGLVERGEDPAATAVREVREETGIEARIIDPLGDVSYFYVWEGVRVRKTVTFFLMRAVGGDPTKHDHEMEDVRWFPADDAVQRADYTSERRMIERALAALSGAAPAP
jgi:8-oxo-dGTP pyrophosphatase MutT (NUDIX family)